MDTSSLVIASNWSCDEHCLCQFQVQLNLPKARNTASVQQVQQQDGEPKVSGQHSRPDKGRRDQYASATTGKF
jgi:hypothetical protein